MTNRFRIGDDVTTLHDLHDSERDASVQGEICRLDAPVAVLNKVRKISGLARNASAVALQLDKVRIALLGCAERARELWLLASGSYFEG